MWRIVTCHPLPTCYLTGIIKIRDCKLVSVVAGYYPAIVSSLCRTTKLLEPPVHHDVVMTTARPFIDPHLDAGGHEVYIASPIGRIPSRQALSVIVQARIQADVAQAAALTPCQLLPMGVRNLRCDSTSIIDYILKDIGKMVATCLGSTNCVNNLQGGLGRVMLAGTLASLHPCHRWCQTCTSIPQVPQEVSEQWHVIHAITWFTCSDSANWTLWPLMSLAWTCTCVLWSNLLWPVRNNVIIYKRPAASNAYDSVWKPSCIQLRRNYL